MTTVSLRMDNDIKSALDNLCNELGMNLTTFFMIYAKKATLQYHNGQVVTKSMEELEAMANG